MFGLDRSFSLVCGAGKSRRLTWQKLAGPGVVEEVRELHFPECYDIGGGLDSCMEKVWPAFYYGDLGHSKTRLDKGC